mgnify:CR=1 FL=1
MIYEQTYQKDPLEKRGVDGNLWIWEGVDYTKSYMVVADVARGDSSDYSAFHVFDVETVEQVAEYKGKIDTKQYGAFLTSVASEWNNAMLVIENANIGWAVIQEVIDRSYQNLYYSYREAGYVDEDIHLFHLLRFRRQHLAQFGDVARIDVRAAVRHRPSRQQPEVLVGLSVGSGPVAVPDFGRQKIRFSGLHAPP